MRRTPQNYPEKWRKVCSMATLIHKIQTKNPDAVRFCPTAKDVKSIVFHIETGTFDTIMYLYGHTFLMALLTHYEEIEEFEKCAGIVDCIRKHNSLVNDTLPTR